MTNHRKHRGYRTQKVIADYLKQWWEYADTAGAGRQGEDILNIPSVSIEVKARSDFQPLAWIKQSTVNANGKMPIVIMRCNGQGEDAGEYLAFMKLKDLIPVLRRIVPTHEITRCPEDGAYMFKGGECTTCQSMNTNAANAEQEQSQNALSLKKQIQYVVMNQCAGFMETSVFHSKEQDGDINETKHRSDQHLYKWI